jgi:hypothetical protein
MSLTFIILFILVSLMLIGAGSEVYRLRQREQLVVDISHELDSLLLAAKAEVVNNKKLVERATDLVKAHTGQVCGVHSAAPSLSDDLSSPEMLASIIAVMVNKVGQVRLSQTDFADVPEAEYVSVYIDTKTQELVLSLNHELDIKNDLSMGLFSLSPKDDIFH